MPRGGLAAGGARGGLGAKDDQDFVADGHDWNSFRDAGRYYPWGIQDAAQTDVYMVTSEAWFSNGSYDGKDVLRSALQPFPVAGTITKIKYYILGNTATGFTEIGLYDAAGNRPGSRIFNSGALETLSDDFTLGREIDVGVPVGPNQMVALAYNVDGGFTSDGMGSPNNRFICAPNDAFYPAVGFADNLTTSQFDSANRLAYGYAKASAFGDMPLNFPGDAVPSTAAAFPSNPVACKFFPIFLFKFEAS